MAGWATRTGSLAGGAKEQEVCGTDFVHIHLNCRRGGWLRPTNQLQIVR